MPEPAAGAFVVASRTLDPVKAQVLEHKDCHRHYLARTVDVFSRTA
jgi:hypothetical protein